MKRTTFLGIALSLLSLGLTAQQSAIEAELQAAAQAETTMEVDMSALLDRYQSLGADFGTVSDHFTSTEMRALRHYLKSQNRSMMADIIPTAGATETFPVAVGDFFFDPGGPGGSSTGGTPGNYPNCGCVTLTTLDGATDIEFLFFSVFANFDWLRIYDSADTSGPVLFDNSAGGANEGDITLADMIASNGSATFTGTSGSLTFEFNATAVVDYGGWEAEVTGVTGGGGGGTDIVYGNEAVNGEYGSFAISDPTDFTAIGPNNSTDEFAGAIDPLNPDTAYVLTNASELLSLDVATGAYTSLGTIALGLGSETPSGMAFDPTTGTLYGIATDVSTSTLFTIDIGSLTATPVGTGTGIPGAIALAIDGDGEAYTYDILGDVLFSIDTSSGVGTAVGPIGFDANFAQGMFWDQETDTIYMAAFNNGDFEAQLRSVDTSTGNTTLVGTIEPGSLVDVTWASTPNNFVTNDDCANATAINCGETLSGDTTDNTDTNGDGAPDEWFAVTSSVAGEQITVSTCDQADFDTILTVYDSCGGAIVAQNDDGDGCTGFTSELSFIADGSSTYFIAVDGFGGASGTFDLTVTCGSANDTCEDALAIECGVPVFGTTVNATAESLPDCGTSITAPGVWYIYEDTTGLVTDITVDTCGGGTDYDTKLSVFTGDCGDLVCVGGNDDDCGLQSSVSFQSDGNTTYYILVHGFASGTGNFELNMTCAPVPPPNDLIVNSIDVDEAGIPYTDPNVAMPFATLENGNPTGCNIDGANGVWYNFVAAGSGTANAQIVSPAGSSYVVFFKAPDEEATEEDLEYFFQVGNQCAPATEANITTQAGQAYYVFVVNTGGVTDIVIDGELLSTVDNVIEGFEYYPNPANETLNLSAVDNIERVAIYNLLGQEVLSREVGGTNTQLNVASLQTGAYLMKVTVNGQVGTYKVIKR